MSEKNNLKKYLNILLILFLVFSPFNLHSEEVQEFSINVGNYFFKPNKITVKVNQTAKLSLIRGIGTTPHNFTLEDSNTGLNIFENLKSGTITVIEFTPKKIGVFNFYCKNKLPFAKSHKEKGMVGTIKVIK